MSITHKTISVGIFIYEDRKRGKETTLMRVHLLLAIYHNSKFLLRIDSTGAGVVSGFPSLLTNQKE